MANQKGIGTNKIIQFTVPFSQLYFMVAQHTKILFDGLIKNYLLELDFMQPCQRKIYIYNISQRTCLSIVVYLKCKFLVFLMICKFQSFFLQVPAPELLNRT